MSTLKLKENAFTLPSLGKGYNPETMPLLNGDTVMIRPLTVGDQRHLAGMSGDPYQAYFGLLSRIITNKPGIKIDELLLDDVNTILYAMRVISYGADYGLTYTCANCQKENTCDVSLTQDVQVRDASEVKNYKTDGIDCKLGGKDITFHLPRLQDDKFINRHMIQLMKDKTIQGEGDRMYVRYAHLIDTVDGEKLNIMDKMEFIDSLSIADLNDFADALNDNAIGIIPEVFKCCAQDNCGFENEVRIGLSADFFRPGRSNNKSE